MANITLVIPDDKIQLVIDALSSVYGYRPILEGGADNPETKAQFSKRMVGEYIKNLVKTYEKKLAEDAYQATQIDIT